MAEQGIKHLVYLQPQQVFDFLLAPTLESFANVTAAHQTVAAFDTMAAIVHRLLKSTDERLPDALQMLLAYAVSGIDINDHEKTLASLKLILREFARARF